MKSDFDWNKQKICSADGEDVPLTPDEFCTGKEFSVQLHNDITEVATITGNLEEALCIWMHEADFLFCCFAWLTNYKVLDAMAQIKYGCQVVVQKEDFLRPDAGHTSRSNGALRKKYEKLGSHFRLGLPGIAGSLSTFSGPEAEAVRCAGVANSDRRNASPRMHHKFAVACGVTASTDEYGNILHKYHPYSVWTGSFNPTMNGAKSRENAVTIDSVTVAEFYLYEWQKVFAMSEPLDWTSEWSDPEWRIGT